MCSGDSVERVDNPMACSKRVYEQPGMIKGIEVLFKVENLLKKENAEKFIKESNKIIQK